MKWLEIDRNNLEMKFLALNSDFCNSSFDPLDLRRHAQVSIKEGYP